MIFTFFVKLSNQLFDINSLKNNKNILYFYYFICQINHYLNL